MGIALIYCNCCRYCLYSWLNFEFHRMVDDLIFALSRAILLRTTNQKES